jgi:hypothetical protein
VDVDIEIVATAACVLSQETLSVGLLDCTLKLVDLIPELTAYVNISGLSAHGETDNQRTLDELVRVVTQNLSVLASTRLRLVRVDN